MSARLAFLLLAATLVAACASPEPAPVPYGPPARSCDDGGYDSGGRGVVIDGVCL